MANYTAADVKKLRELTGAGMMDCKNALVEAEGEVEKAVELLRIKGQKGVAKREGRDASNGAVVSLLAEDNSTGVLVELNCETDFVAKGDKFVVVADALVAHVAKTSPADLEAALASEINPGQTVQQFVDEANATLGEKIELPSLRQLRRRLRRGLPAPHRPRPAAASRRPGRSSTRPTRRSPRTSRSTSPPSPRPTSPARRSRPRRGERASHRRGDRPRGGQARGRPAEASSRAGSTASSRRTSVLEQAFAKDNKKTVQKVLDEAGVTLVRFARFRVGA